MIKFRTLFNDHLDSIKWEERQEEERIDENSFSKTMKRTLRLDWELKREGLYERENSTTIMERNKNRKGENDVSGEVVYQVRGLTARGLDQVIYEGNVSRFELKDASPFTNYSFELLVLDRALANQVLDRKIVTFQTSADGTIPVIKPNF